MRMDYRHDGGSSSSGGGDRARSIAAREQQGEVCIQFMEKLQQMYEAKHMCDLVFELRGHQFYSHRVVMAAWSPLVHTLCSKDTTECEKIRVNYDNLDVFGSFLAFLYAGQMNSVAEDNLIQVLHLATSLQVNGLRQTCEEALKRQLHIGNIISTFHVARKFRLPNLEEYALNFMQMNLPEAVKQADFLSLTPTRFNSFLSSGWVCVMKPEIKLFLIISWLGYDVKERQQYLILLLKYIDWSTVANDFLQEISQTENFFTTNESSLYLLLQTLFSSTIPLGPYTDLFPGLRERYGYLLEHIVQNSYVLPLEPEEYFPVTLYVVNQPPGKDTQPASATTEDRRKENGLEQHSRNAEDDVSDDGGDMAMLGGFADHDITADARTSGLENVSAEEDGISRDKTVKNQIPSKVRGGKSQTPETPGSSESQSSSKRRKRGQPRRLDQTSLPISALAKSSPEKQQNSTKAKLKGPLTLKYKECKKSEPKPHSVESQEAERSKTDAVPTDSSLDRQTCVTSLRSKRKAAAKFSVPEKLMPRRKTKAAVRKLPVCKNDQQPNTLQKKRNKTEVLDRNTSDDDEDGDGDEIRGDEEVDDTKDSEVGSPVNKQRASPRSKVRKNKPISSAKTPTRSDKLTLAYSSEPERTGQQPEVATEDDESLDTTSNQGKSDKHRCDECKYVAPSAKRLARHIQYVHTGVSTIYSCTMCDFECRWNKGYYTHMRQHFAGPPFACDKDGCGFTADKVQLLLTHRRKHTDERPFKCDTCNASFRSRNNLYAHRKCHSEDRNYECPVCRRCFKMKNTMEQHLVTHSDLRPYLCDTCGFSTKFQSHLIAHKRIHTGEVFHCSFPMCKYSSPKRSQLKAHMRSHLQIRRHECNICQKGFVERSHLVRHMKIHEDNRPFRCHQCDYSSTRLDKLRDHIGKHHGDEASAKRKWTPRNKKCDKGMSAASHPSPKKVKSATVRGTPARDSAWTSSMEASIATLVSAAEEVGLTSNSPFENNGRESVGGMMPLQANMGPRGQEAVGGSEMAEYSVRHVQYAPHSYKHEAAATPGPVARDIGAGQMMIADPSRNIAAGNQVTLSYDNTEGGTYEILQPHRQSQRHLRPILPRQTSASLLQQLAMTVSSSPSGHPSVGQPSLSSGDVNPNPSLLPHTSSADVAAASQILLSAMQQHATASAADSLASLSYALPPTGVHGQEEVGSHMAQQNPSLPLSHVPQLHHSQPHSQQHTQHVQPHSQSHAQQADGHHHDYNGLNAFMALF